MSWVLVAVVVAVAARLAWGRGFRAGWRESELRHEELERWG